MELAEILYQKTNDELYTLAKLCDYSGAKRKDDLVRHLHKQIMTPGSLKRLWQQLDYLSQKAVASAYHHGGEFEASAFVAQYGALPERPKSRWSWSYEPILLDLFIHNGHLPDDLLPLLKELVPPPERFQVQGLKSAPTLIDPEGHPIDLIRAETEQTGWHDLLAYLRLVDQGQIKISASSRATIGSIKKITESLREGDFFALPEKYRATETIRPYGLDVFAQGSNLVQEARGSHRVLELTEAGRAFYQTQHPEILLEAFETWTEEGYFDELSRLTALKGLKSRSTYLTRSASRREKVIEALSWCPVDVWIDIEDFYRAVKIWHFDFDVETTYYSNLYVGYKDYGSLYGETYWRIVKGLYINAIIWEYLGSIGAVDLLYTDAQEAYFEANLDYYYLDEPYSPYDGLKYFRINNLGAYLLGQAGEYISAVPRQPVLFVISDDLEITMTEPDLMMPNDQHFLEQMTAPLKDGRYRLDTRRLLTSLEEGADLVHLRDFLRDRHSGPLPEEVYTWLEMIEAHSQAFKRGGRALFIRVKSPALAEMVMEDATLGKFCKLLDPKTIVIPVNKEKVFRAQLKTLEYVLLD